MCGRQKQVRPNGGQVPSQWLVLYTSWVRIPQVFKERLSSVVCGKQAGHLHLGWGRLPCALPLDTLLRLSKEIQTKWVHILSVELYLPSLLFSSEVIIKWSVQALYHSQIIILLPACAALDVVSKSIIRSSLWLPPSSNIPDYVCDIFHRVYRIDHRLFMTTSSSSS